MTSDSPPLLHQSEHHLWSEQWLVRYRDMDFIQNVDGKPSPRCAGDERTLWKCRMMAQADARRLFKPGATPAERSQLSISLLFGTLVLDKDLYVENQIVY